MIKYITLFAVFSILAFAAHAQNRNPYKSIGKKGKVITLTQGEYEESFDDDSIQQIGTALVNIHIMQVVKFELTKEEQRIIDETAVSRFLSVDPLTKKFAMLTPYQYASNRPIDGIDFDGKEWTTSKTLDANSGVTTIDYSIQLKVVKGSLNDDKVGSIISDAQSRLFNALQGTADEKTKYAVSINYSTIDMADVPEAQKSSIVINFKDYRALNQSEHDQNKNTYSVGVNKSTTQSGSIDLTTYDPTSINSKGKLQFSEQSTGVLGLAVIHELLHGGRLSHPYQETWIKDIQQFQLNENRDFVKDANGNFIRSQISDDVILNNIMNSGANPTQTLIPKKLSDLKTLTKGQADAVNRVVNYEQKQNQTQKQ